MIIELTTKKWKVDKNDPINIVRKYVPFAFNYPSAFQRNFNAMLCFLYYKSARRNRDSFS